MAKTQTKYRSFKLHDEEYAIPGERMSGEPLRIIEGICIDRSCFQKTKHEKEILKLAKQLEKDENKK